ncbi:hypothetical protein O3S80_11845 [Streptomyces sp. Lzd4kr]|nr:hypothetical protein [Streptomyces sp. Lzd4kr]
MARRDFDRVITELAQIRGMLEDPATGLSAFHQDQDEMRRKVLETVSMGTTGGAGGVGACCEAGPFAGGEVAAYGAQECRQGGQRVDEGYLVGGYAAGDAGRRGCRLVGGSAARAASWRWAMEALPRQ